MFNNIINKLKANLTPNNGDILNISIYNDEAINVEYNGNSYKFYMDDFDDGDDMYNNIFYFCVDLFEQ